MLPEGGLLLKERRNNLLLGKNIFDTLSPELISRFIIWRKLDD